MARLTDDTLIQFMEYIYNCTFIDKLDGMYGFYFPLTDEVKYLTYSDIRNIMKQQEENN